MATSDKRVLGLGITVLLFAVSALLWFLMGHPLIALLNVGVGIVMVAAAANARPQGDDSLPSLVQRPDAGAEPVAAPDRRA